MVSCILSSLDLMGREGHSTVHCRHQTDEEIVEQVVLLSLVHCLHLSSVMTPVQKYPLSACLENLRLVFHPEIGL